MDVRRNARRVLAGLAGLAALAALTALSPDTSTGYIARQALFQGEMLWGRVPLDSVRDDPGLTEAQRERLAWIAPVQRFGDQIGLASSKSYHSINPTWDKTIYNVSACDPVAFRTVRWRFPIVGTVPYLGYFRPEDARRRKRALEARGYDVWVRTAGAYSTLGWFADPVLPQMLRWDEGRLANTLLHERAHATLWIPGSVRFNESFANFVGNEAELRYLDDRYGEDSDEVREELERREDSQRYQALMHETWQALNDVYEDPERGRGDKLRDKAVILGGLPTRVAEAGMHNEKGYLRAARRGPWNNARLAQFRTYHSSQDHFAALLAQEDGDLRRFIDRLGEVTRGAKDPYKALAVAVGAEPVADAGD